MCVTCTIDRIMCWYLITARNVWVRHGVASPDGRLCSYWTPDCWFLAGICELGYIPFITNQFTFQPRFDSTKYQETRQKYISIGSKIQSSDTAEEHSCGKCFWKSFDSRHGWYRQNSSFSTRLWFFCWISKQTIKIYPIVPHSRSSNYSLGVNWYIQPRRPDRIVSNLFSIKKRFFRVQHHDWRWRFSARVQFRGYDQQVYLRICESNCFAPEGNKIKPSWTML